MKNLLLLLCFIFSFMIKAQIGSVSISVFDEFSKKPVVARVKLENSDTEFTGNGNVKISDIPSGTYTFQISATGYETGFLKEINVVPNQNLTFWIPEKRTETRHFPISDLFLNFNDDRKNQYFLVPQRFAPERQPRSL